MAGDALSRGLTDGTGTLAHFDDPTGLAASADGRTVWVSDTGNHVIRVIRSGVVSVLAGSTPGAQDGVGSIARFRRPVSLLLASFNGAETLIVSDSGNDCIRAINPQSGIVSTLAGLCSDFGGGSAADGVGSNAAFRSPMGLAKNSAGLVFVADLGNCCLRSISALGQVATFAGQCGTCGSADGDGTWAALYSPFQVTFAPNDFMLVSQMASSVIRMVSPSGRITSLAYPSSSSFSLVFDNSGALVISDDSSTVRRFPNWNASQSLLHGQHIIAGVASVFRFANGFGACPGCFMKSLPIDASQLSTAFLSIYATYPNIAAGGLLSVDSDTIWVADTSNNAIRQISLNGTVLPSSSCDPGWTWSFGFNSACQRCVGGQFCPAGIIFCGLNSCV